MLNFTILTPKNNLGGHPLILGRPWLATVDALVSCRSRDIFISKGNSTQDFTLYPPAETITKIENQVWIEDDDDDFEKIQPVLTISQNDQEGQLINLMNNRDFYSYCEQN